MFNPFDKDFSEIQADDLAVLRSVQEGWFVEYKRKGLSADRLAKSLCAFANAEGGWLFLGIAEGTNDGMAAEFPGIDTADRAALDHQIRQAANAHCSRPPAYEPRYLEGPCAALNLAPGKFICAIRVPRSRDVPHVHSSGTIYRRVGSGSEPKPETDRSSLDKLLSRRKQLVKDVQRFTKWRPRQIRNNSVTGAHVYLIPRPLRDLDYKTLSLADFVTSANSGSGMRFNNFYAIPGGIVARHVIAADLLQQAPTLRYWHNGWAHLTIPLDSFAWGNAHHAKLQHMKFLQEFELAHDLAGRLLIDVMSLAYPLGELLKRYRHVLHTAQHGSPDLSACITLAPVGLRIPYIDLQEYVSFTQLNGVAHVERDRVSDPASVELENLIQLVRNSELDPSHDFYGFDEAFALFRVAAECLGVPGTFFTENAEQISELLQRRTLALMSRATPREEP